MADKKTKTDVLLDVALEMYKGGRDYAMLDGKLYLYIFSGEFGALVLDNTGKWYLE